MSPRRRPGRDDIQAGTHALNEIEELHLSWTPAFVGAAINSALPQADKAGTKQVCCRRRLGVAGCHEERGQIRAYKGEVHF